MSIAAHKKQSWEEIEEEIKHCYSSSPVLMCALKSKWQQRSTQCQGWHRRE